MSTSPPPSAADNPDPWSYPSETIDLSARHPDVLISPGEAAYEARSHRRRLPSFIAAALAVALVLGGVAYAGMRLWYGSGAQPEEATPSTVVAFARLDLSPGLGQGRNLNSLVKKFPQESGKDTVDELKKGIFEALDVDEAAYRKHVEPWFAERVGVAWWIDGQQRPYGLIMLAAKDESAARAGLTELRRQTSDGGFGFVVRRGYALVARGDKESQAAADAADKEAERESLAASAQFRRGVDWLPGQQAALGWADLARLGQATNAMTESSLRDMPRAPGEEPMPSSVAADPMGAFFGVPGLGVFPGIAGPGQSGDLKGQVIVGAQATGNGVEVRYRGFGADVEGLGTDARSTVDSLPANSAIAGAFRLGDVGKQFAGMGPGPEEMLPPEGVLKDMPPGEADRMREEMRVNQKQFETMHKAFAALSGAKISFAATGVGQDDIPALDAAAETTSADQAAKLVEAVQLLFPDEVTVSASGDKVELKTKRNAPERGGALAGEALYQEALDGTPQEATAVLYVDIQRLFADQPMSDKERRQAEPVKAIGLAASMEDGDPVGLLRIVIR
ncbi:MAG TPA: hypothetical protein VHN18_04455 [Micromonosporaceae bacterium]|nr:hypothetical protein [Micromonosporaceae bacterium]